MSLVPVDLGMAADRCDSWGQWTYLFLLVLAPGKVLVKSRWASHVYALRWAGGPGFMGDLTGSHPAVASQGQVTGHACSLWSRLVAEAAGAWTYCSQAPLREALGLGRRGWGACRPGAAKMQALQPQQRNGQRARMSPPQPTVPTTQLHQPQLLLTSSGYQSSLLKSSKKRLSSAQQGSFAAGGASSVHERRPRCTNRLPQPFHCAAAHARTRAHMHTRTRTRSTSHLPQPRLGPLSTHMPMPPKNVLTLLHAYHPFIQGSYIASSFRRQLLFASSGTRSPHGPHAPQGSAPCTLGPLTPPRLGPAPWLWPLAVH